MMGVKSIVWTSAAFLVAAGIFDFICFWYVPEYTDSFFVSIAFGNASLLFYALATVLMARKGRYIYLSIQDGFIIGGYTVVCIILNSVFALCRMNNLEASIITNAMLLSVYLIILFIFFANTASITWQMEQDKKERNAFYELKDSAEVLLNRSTNIQTNKKIESLYDKICSCPISRTIDVSSYDERILAKLSDISQRLDRGDEQFVIINDITNLMFLIDERNRLIMNSLKR